MPLKRKAGKAGAGAAAAAGGDSDDDADMQRGAAAAKDYVPRHPADNSSDEPDGPDGSGDEDDEDAEANDDGGEPQTLNVEFDATPPTESDYHGIQTMLKQLFRSAVSVNLAELTDLIIKQDHVGSVLRVRLRRKNLVARYRHARGQRAGRQACRRARRIAVHVQRENGHHANLLSRIFTFNPSCAISAKDRGLQIALALFGALSHQSCGPFY